MTTERSDLSWHSDQELLVLHGVRLGGFATTEAVAERAALPADVVGDQLGVLESQGLVEHMTFGDASGWILTEDGKERDTELLQEELQLSGAQSALRTALENFESGPNAQLVQVITHWQLQSSPEHATTSSAVVQELTELADALEELMVPLTHRLPRFRRYPHQFREAVQKARSGVCTG